MAVKIPIKIDNILSAKKMVTLFLMNSIIFSCKIKFIYYFLSIDPSVGIYPLITNSDNNMTVLLKHKCKVKDNHHQKDKFLHC